MRYDAKAFLLSNIKANISLIAVVQHRYSTTDRERESGTINRVGAFVFALSLVTPSIAIVIVQIIYKHIENNVHYSGIVSVRECAQ